MSVISRGAIEVPGSRRPATGRRLRAALAAFAATAAVGAHGLLVTPVAQAALKAAAGPGGAGDNQDLATKMQTYTNAVADILMWIAIPGVTLGAVAVGAMFMAGSHRAGTVGIGLVLGLGIVASSKAIAL
jgi:hypothetical protein